MNAMESSVYFYFTLIFLHQAVGLKSFSSDIRENEKPILRTGGNDDNISELRNNNTIDPPWLADLREGISQLVREHGYHDAKPHIQKLVEETEKSKKVLLHVKVGRDGSTSIETDQLGPAFRAKKSKKAIKRDIEPFWLIEFQGFVKALVRSYGWDKAKEMLKHFIKTLEQKHRVVIEDVDVDQFGEVFVRYFDKAARKKRKSKKKRAGRHSKSSES